MAARPSVVVVEDDATVRSVVADYLRAAGYDVSTFSDGPTALTALASGLPDVVVLDRMLPGMSGDELCVEVRRHSDVPVLMLTALGGVEDRIGGLERGADDYLTKPFAMRELQLRVRALLRRRVSADGSSEFSLGPFRVDPVRRRVWNGTDEVNLTAREYDLLLYLVRHPERVFTRYELLHAVWGWTFGDASTVTVHVRRLREKIESDPHSPVHLRTVWGAGYRFVPGGAGRAAR